MAWTIEYAASAAKALRKLDRADAGRIVDYLDHHIAPLDDARNRGKALSGPLGGYWRYRIGDFRIVCDIQDAHFIVVVVRVAHRKAVYR